MSVFLMMAMLASQADVIIAPPDDHEEVAAAEEPSEKPGSKLCKEIILTGGRLGTRKVCATKEEWAGFEREAEDITREVTAPPARSKMPGSGH